jgi:putative membrane protein
MRIEELLDERAFAAIEGAVQSAERATSGEIVPMLVERSDPYAEARFGAAALFAFALGGLALFLAPPLWPWLVPTQIGVFAASAWLLGRRALLRRLVPPEVSEARVARAASLAFREAALVETRASTRASSRERGTPW